MMHFGWIGTAIIIASGFIGAAICFASGERKAESLGGGLIVISAVICLCYFLALAISTYLRNDD